MRHQFGGNGQRFLPLRYGMNPHQSSDAELYSLQANMPIKGWLREEFWKEENFKKSCQILFQIRDFFI